MYNYQEISGGPLLSKGPFYANRIPCLPPKPIQNDLTDRRKALPVMSVEQENCDAIECGRYVEHAKPSKLIVPQTMLDNREGLGKATSEHCNPAFVRVLIIFFPTTNTNTHHSGSRTSMQWTTKANSARKSSE